MKLEWQVVQRSPHIDRMWLKCPVCDSTTTFTAEEVSRAIKIVTASAPFLKCEFCDFQAFLPETLEAPYDRIVTAVLKPDTEGEAWIEVDGSGSNQEDNRRSALSWSLSSEDPRKFISIQRSP